MCRAHFPRSSPSCVTRSPLFLSLFLHGCNEYRINVYYGTATELNKRYGKEEEPESQPKSLPLPLSNEGIGGTGFVWRFGELIEAPKEANRRIPPATILGELALEGDDRWLGESVGVPGRDESDLGDSPEAASVRRNSTHRREND